MRTEVKVSPRELLTMIWETAVRMVNRHGQWFDPPRPANDNRLDAA